MDRREFLKGMAVASLWPACSGWQAAAPPTALQTKGKKPIVILGAMPQEVEHYQTFLQNPQEVQDMVAGKWSGHQVYVGLTGIGIGDAAGKTHAIIERYNPSAIIFTGVAGSLDEKVGIGDIGIVHSAVNYEMDVRGFDSTVYSLGQHLFEPVEKRLARSDPHLLELCQRYAEQHLQEPLFHAYAATGSKFLVDEKKVSPAFENLTKQFFNREIAPLLTIRMEGEAATPNICDMETAAILRAANRAHIPAVAIRIVSDSYHGDAPAEFLDFIAQGVRRYVPLVKHVLENI